MIKKIILLFLLMAIFSTNVFADVNNYYEIKLKYDEKGISLISSNVISHDGQIRNIEGGYIATIIDNDAKVLNLTFFDIPLKVAYDNYNQQEDKVDSGGVLELKEKKFTIYLPYYIHGQKIKIYDKNADEKLTIDVSSYAKTIPKEHEEIPKITEEREEPIKKIPETEKKPTNKTLFLVFGLIVFITLLFIIIKIIRSKKTNY
jgi:hypothetical protein